MNNSKLLLPLLAAGMLSLTACGAVPVSDTTTCPPIVQYDDAFNKQLADELENVPADSATMRAIEDYIRERDQLRKCQPD